VVAGPEAVAAFPLGGVGAAGWVVGFVASDVNGDEPEDGGGGGEDNGDCVAGFDAPADGVVAAGPLEAGALLAGGGGVTDGVEGVDADAGFPGGFAGGGGSGSDAMSSSVGAMRLRPEPISPGYDNQS